MIFLSTFRTLILSILSIFRGYHGKENNSLTLTLIRNHLLVTIFRVGSFFRQKLSDGIDFNDIQDVWQIPTNHSEPSYTLEVRWRISKEEHEWLSALIGFTSLHIAELPNVCEKKDVVAFSDCARLIGFFLSSGEFPALPFADAFARAAGSAGGYSIPWLSFFPRCDLILRTSSWSTNLCCRLFIHRWR